MAWENGAREVVRMFKWLAALVSGGIGILLGLVIAIWASSPSDQLREEDSKIRETNRQLRADLDAGKKNSRGTSEDFLKLRSLSKEMLASLKKHEEEGRYLEKALGETSVELTRTNALLHMLREAPEFAAILQTSEFKERFKPEWYFPDEAFRMLGGRWFVEELVAKKAANDHDLRLYADFLQGKPARGVVAGGGDGVAVAAAAQPITQKWHTVVAIRARGSKTTDFFEIRRRLWRVTWTGEAIVGAYDTEGIVGHGYGAADSTIIHAGPGRYYLTIATQHSTQVTVEEPEEE